MKWLESLKSSDRNQNEETTKILRNKGNTIYKSAPMEAIVIYTQAIYAAPKNSVELGLAHANRAAALMANNYFEVNITFYYILYFEINKIQNNFRKLSMTVKWHLCVRIQKKIKKKFYLGKLNVLSK